MRRIVILVLMLLIGGYGAAQAQNMTPEMEAATENFLGMKWGAGIGVTGSFGGQGAVEKASLAGTDKLVRVDEEGDLRPQMFLEMHAFLGSFDHKIKDWRNYQQKMAEYRRGRVNNQPTTLDQSQLPIQGIGPFIALQAGADNAIDALALGVMWGRRNGVTESNSANIGVGLSFDPSVQVLGDGVKESQKLPDGETAVRYKKEGRFGWALMVSFTFR